VLLEPGKRARCPERLVDLLGEDELRGTPQALIMAISDGL